MSVYGMFKAYMQLRKFENFKFLDPGILSDGEIKLQLAEVNPAIPDEGLVPEYRFYILLKNTGVRVGYIDFRIFLTSALKKFGGNIGYAILPVFQGNHYAAKALLLLLEFIKRHGLSSLLITCAETNIASRKTCERAGARLVKIKETRTDMNEIKPTCYYVLQL